MIKFNKQRVEGKIGIKFNDPNLLRTALTHSSYANDIGVESNENLEYLGDSILGFIVADLLYRKYVEIIDEGKLSKKRSNIVCTNSLIEVSKKLGLDKELMCTNGNLEHGSRKSKQYGDIIEAIIGAIYIDRGLEKAREFILFAFSDIIYANTMKQTKGQDYKSALQEYVQKRKLGEIEYRFLSKQGYDHEPTFNYQVYIGGRCFGQGTGSNKKLAQAEAAQVGLENLREEYK